MDSSISKKEEILLDILNKILLQNNKTCIKDINDFTLEKDDLTKPENYKIIENNYDKIFKYYKKDSSHYRRSLAKNYIVILLKNMYKQLNKTWTHVDIDKGVLVDGIKYRKKKIRYVIKN